MQPVGYKPGVSNHFDALCQKQMVIFICVAINRLVVVNYAKWDHISNMEKKEIKNIKESKLVILNFIHEKALTCTMGSTRTHYGFVQISLGLANDTLTEL